MSARPTGRADRARGAARARAHQVLPRLGFGLLDAAEDPTADARLRARRLAGRPAGVDPREVLGVDRLRRPPRERARRRDEMLDNVMLYWVTGLGDVVGAPLLGELRARQAPDRRPCRPASPSIPRRSCRRCASGSSELLPEHRALARARQGRPLRRLRGARDVRRRPARLGGRLADGRSVSRSATATRPWRRSSTQCRAGSRLWRSPSKYSRNAASSANSATIEKSNVPGLMPASRPIRYDATPVEGGHVVDEAALVVVDLLDGRVVGELEQHDVADHAPVSRIAAGRRGVDPRLRARSVAA